MAGRLATIAVPSGVAASPDLTILPLRLAASAYWGGAAVPALAAFAATTLATFVVVTVVATAAGYQFRGEWLEGPRQHDHVPGPDGHRARRLCQLLATAGWVLA
jgi:hypothetical protein